MRRISTFGAAVAGLAFAMSPVLLAQQTQDTTNTNAGSHVQDTRPETSPSNAQNDPDRNGAQDPARVGTTTRSNQDMNNNRYPTSSSQQKGTLTQTTSPATTYEAPATTTNTTTTTSTSTEPAPAAEPAPATDTSTPPSTLPRTASRVPLAGLTGLAALGAALAVRSRRLR